jgi:hypothetical protein
LAAALARPQFNPVPFNALLDWLTLISVFATALVLLLAGCLLFLRQRAALRAAWVLLWAAALGLVSEAALTIPVTLQASWLAPGGVWFICVTGPVFLFASFWVVVTMVTAVKLGRHLKQ